MRIYMLSSITVIFTILFVSIPCKNIHAIDINQETKSLYQEGKDLTEIDNFDRSKEKHELGFKKFKQAIELDKNYYDAYVGLAKAYWDYAIVYVGSKKTNMSEQELYKGKAREIIKKAISIAPNNPLAYQEYMYISTGEERDKARAKLFELEPNNPDMLTWRGYSLIEKGKVMEGVDLVLKGIRGADTGEIWSKKEELAETLKKKGYAKEAGEITHSVNNERKYNEGKMQLMYQDVDSGLRLIKESADGDLNRLDASQKALVAKELENRQRYKDAAQMFELIDPIKYQDHIRDLKIKSDSQKSK